ncbi:MAG: hypothetical protein Q9162_003597 [Coniocarpon cinnabarinum]
MSSEHAEAANSPIPTTETNAADDAATSPAEGTGATGDVAESTITSAQWEAFQNMLVTIYGHRTENGQHDPSKVFHRKPNKRTLPSYYEVIKEPLALSTIKARLNLKQYPNVQACVRDFALIPHNAQVYNRPDAGAYLDALEIRSVLERELKKLVDAGTVTGDGVKLPYLGEIPEPDPPPEEDAAEEESDEEEEDSGEETDESSTKRRGRGRPKGSRTGKKDDDEHALEFDPRGRKRGRPPKVDTPVEARIKNIMKVIRRPKLQGGALKMSYFDRLPDKAQMPEYYTEIKNPMAADMIKKRMKRKKYADVAGFMKDIDLMFDNAKVYNEDDSEIYKLAVELQKEAHKTANEENAKPDTDFVDEEGRIPLPNGVMHNGELYQVGDWVHVQNANDFTKPIPAQIYRTWQDAAGTKFINACWYYRPEQTVHRFDKHFFENEVVKTGQYRDHQVDEIVDRCFIMFVTRYGKGRPRGFPPDKEIYVCESRYNEDKQRFNKIKTWASCLPDEVREKDYEMEMFKEPRRMKKLPSPIAYLLKDEQKDTDDPPKPVWGADNAPPKIGAVHRRQRDPKESPPPEPTPPPPPTPETKAPSPIKSMQTTAHVPAQPSSNQSHASTPRPQPTSIQPQPATNPPQQQRSSQQPSTTTPTTLNRSASNHRTASNYGTAQTANPRMAQTTANNVNNSNRNTTTAGGSHTSSVQNYQAPQAVEVYHLQDAVNNGIPPDIRSQFQCDDFGRLLFFTTPPVDVRAREKQGAGLAHSPRYIAAMKRRAEERERKRKRVEDEDEEREQERWVQAKQREAALAERAEALQKRAGEVWREQLRDATMRDLESLPDAQVARRQSAT